MEAALSAEDGHNFLAWSLRAQMWSTEVWTGAMSSVGEEIVS